MADIFISYSKKDRPYAEELAKFLEELGLTTWWDANLVGGQEFRARITDEIDRSKVAIVIWSPNSIKSAFVIDEADHARQSEKLLSAIAPGFKADKIPIGFRGSHVVSIGEGDQLIQALIAADVGDLRRTGGYLLGIFAKQIKAIERNTRRTQRLALAAFSAVVVAAAAFAGSYWLLQPSIRAYPSTSIQSKKSRDGLDIDSGMNLYFGSTDGNVSEIARLYAPSYTVQELSVMLYDKTFRQLASKSDKKDMRLIIGSMIQPKLDARFSLTWERGDEIFVVTCASLSRGSNDAALAKIGHAVRYRNSDQPGYTSSWLQIDIGEDQLERLRHDSGCKLSGSSIAFR